MSSNLINLDFLKMSKNSKNYKEGIIMKKTTYIKEVQIMKKMIMTLFLVALSVVLTHGNADATVAGVCSDCHTMHNSQNNSPMNYDGVTTAPEDNLLRGDCLGCHGQGNADNLEGSSNTIPQVLHTQGSTGTGDLAGGNFGYLTGVKTLGTGGTTLNAGHNVIDINVVDTVNTTPPGDEHSTGITNANFTCAGQFGCHGDRTATSNFAAVSGGHHADDSVLKFGSISEADQGSTTALSYRFLKGVKGGEDSDWEATVSASDHNEYKGSTDGTESTKTAPGGGTISGLCAECHGDFHSSADIGGPTGTPWERHPTDISLPNTGGYATYNPDGEGTTDPGEYNPLAPVARVTIPNASTATVTESGTDDDIVMCLSCHRAHASPYADMLRWEYTMSAGASNDDFGCFVCHTDKNAD
jgi:predicted CXXCH cytochrome family protein